MPCGLVSRGRLPGPDCTRRPTSRAAPSGEPARVVLRNELVVAVPAPRRRPGRRRASSPGPRRRPCGPATRRAPPRRCGGTAGPCCPRSPTSRGPTSRVELARLQHLDLLRLLRPLGGAAARGAGRRGGAPGPGPRPRRGAVTAAVPCVQLERLEQALHRELGAAPEPEAVELRSELERARRDRQERPSPPAAEGASGGSGCSGAARWATGSAPSSRAPAPGEASRSCVAGPPASASPRVLDLADAVARRDGWRRGPRRSVVRRGAVALLAGPRGAERVVPPAPRPPRRAGGRLPGRDRARAGGRDLGWTGESSHQRLFVAAAELMRVAAAGPGCCSRRRPAGRRRGVVAAAPLPLPVRRRRAGRAGAGPSGPAPSRVHDLLAGAVARGGGQVIDLPPLAPAATRRLLADRFPELDELAVDEIATRVRACPSPCSRWRGPGSPAGVRAAVLPGAALETFRRVALLGMTFTTDELLGLADGTEDEAYDQLELASPPWSSSRPRAASASGTPWCARPWSRSCRRTSARAPTVAWPRRWPRSAAPGAGRPPLPRRRPRVARRALRRPGRGDRWSARRLPRRAGLGGRGARARRTGRPAGPAGAPRRPADGAR